MTEPSPGSIAAGWYSDPAGSGQLRWWSGTAWTAHLTPLPHPISDGAGTDRVDAAAVIPTRWTTAAARLLALTPVVYVVVYLGSLPALAALPDFATIVAVAGLSTFLPLVLAMIFTTMDWYRLGTYGYSVRPSIWWTLLSPAAYLVSRARKLGRASGHGAGPLWTWIATWALSAAVAGIVSLLAVPGISAAIDARNLAAGIQSSFSSAADPYAVSCPPDAEFTVGSRFTCTAVDGATHEVHAVAIRVIAAPSGAPTIRIRSVTPAIVP